MSVISRGTLPNNFLDSVTNSGLVLPTPEPQRLFAQMAMAGRLSLAAIDAGMSTAQQYVSMVGGGAAVSPDLDRLARVADQFPNAIQTIDNFGLGKGDTIKFQRHVYDASAESAYTFASRELATNATISTTGQTVQTEEVPVVLKEYTGPTNGTSTAPYAIWDFDAKYRANKLQLAGIVTRHLQRDYTKLLDVGIRDLFAVSNNITHADDVTDVTSMVAGAGHIHSLETWMRARKALSDREWQPFSTGRYMAIVNTTFNTDMVQDADYSEQSKTHADGRNLIFGYIGSVQDIDFYECSTLRSFAAGATATGSGTVPSGVTVHESMLIGPGAVGFGTALAPEARYADDTNYGTVAKVIWYALHAAATLDTRGVQRVLTQEG